MCKCDSQYIGRYGKSLEIRKISAISPTTAEVIQGKPLVAAIYELPCSFFTTGGNSTIEEIELLELASSEANVRRVAVQIPIFNQPPDVPVLGTIYDIDMTKCVAQFFTGAGVATAAAQRTGYLRATAAKSRAVMNIHTSVPAHADHSSLWAVLLADATFTYAGSTFLELVSKIRRHV